ncbi:Apple protein [Mycena venus]|uniref:Apple protein n=1 Tax=Mycena venus TaxID=2733690 RepID=A0A8H7CLV7_9AGAR|nr:Apple protein [Mycena venus]
MAFTRQIRSTKMLTPLLGLSFGSDTVSSGGLDRRAQCKLTWNPLALLKNCVILPVVKAVLPSAIYKVIDAVLGVFDVKKLYEFFKTVIQVVVAIISESGYTPSGEVTFDTNSSLIPLQNTSDFGWAYPLLNIAPIEHTSKNSKKSVEGTLSVFCVGCRINGVFYLLVEFIGSDRSRQFMKHRSKFQFTLRKGFTSAEVELVDGSIDFAAGIGILFDLTYKGTIFEQRLFEVPLSPLTIPGIIVIGPFLQMKTGLDYELRAKGKVLARNNIGWSDMTAKLDMLDRTKSYIGKWTRHDPVPLVSVELEGYATLKPHVTAGIYFGVSILSGKLKVSTGIEAEASLPVTASVAVKGGTDTAISFDKCKGVTVSLDAKLEINLILEAGKFTRPYPISEWEFPVYSKCIGMEIAVQKDKLAPNVPVPMLPPADPNATYRTINAQLKNQVLNVLWLPKPHCDLIAVPPAEVVDGPGTIHRLFQSLNTIERNATAGVYDNRVLHFNEEAMYYNSVSPLTLSSKDAVPENAIVVALRSEIGKDGRPAFVGAVIGNRAGDIEPGDYFYPIVCIYDPKYRTPATVFLAKDPVEGPKHLMRLGKLAHIPSPYSIYAGPPFDYCAFAPFTIS